MSLKARIADLPPFAQSEDFAVYTADATEFGADKTGARDSTAEIQRAIDACEKAEGGTVFLPAGRYKVLGRLSVPGGVTLRGDADTQAIIDCDPATNDDWATEYLDLILSIKIVDSIDEAITHINRYGSHHTDAIMAEDDAAAAHFMQLVDSAGVYRNCSTRFADGFRYGFGAEVGISTSKLHARGPVGLEGLVTYKYEIEGHGHIVGDYATGKRSFHFKDL